MMRTLRHVTGLMLLLALPGAAAAQSGAALIMTPWDEPTYMQNDVNVRAFSRADVRRTDERLRIGHFQARGRFRTNIDPEVGEDDLRFGYEAMYWDLHSDDQALPNRLVDTSVAGGWSRDPELGRTIGAVVGVGYAGVRPFAEGEALYGMADVIFRQALDRQSMITLGINYDGNRTLWPDIPLPIVAYSRRMNDELSINVGVPASVRWTPTDEWRFSASYVPPWTVNARGEYRFHEAWAVFVAYDGEYHGFAAEGTRDRRLFFRQRRAEAGVRYEPHHQWHLTLAGGYAFSRRFERGWDTRNTSTVRDIDDTPYFRTVVGFNF